MKQGFWTIVAKTPHLLLRADLCSSAGDPKLSSVVPPVYVPIADFEQAQPRLSNPAQIRAFDPATDMQRFYGTDAAHGLLYLPYPYLVPGGRFNEMYGWDTAFAVFAWAKIHPRIMREQVDNQLYQIRTYGKVLNANRTYYLSRSQPPLIAAMTLHVWDAAQGRDWKDFDPEGLYANANDWLSKTYGDLGDYYTYWTTGGRLADGLPLSRYWDDSDLPAPEVAAAEHGYFNLSRHHFAENCITPEEREDRALFYDENTDTLTALYHRGNRAMRASGFDPTRHWGYGGLRCMFHAPVCLNALLYRMEDDMAKITDTLSCPDQAVLWRSRRDARKKAMHENMFDARTGLYYDYDFIRKKKTEKPFASIFHLLWSGVCDDNADLAHRVAMGALEALETSHGIAMSGEISGSQWDRPYGWPPIQYFAFAGLKRCGLDAEARRIAQKFIDLATHVYDARHALFEKYNVEEGSPDIHVTHGYHENVTEHGTFLWTAATLKMARDCLQDA